MSTWIFQGNPDKFRIDEYLRDFNEIFWAVKQEHFKDQIEQGDTVYIWRAGGKSKLPSGIVAKGIVLSKPELRHVPQDMQEYWIENNNNNESLQVIIRILNIADKEKKVIKRSSLIKDPILKNMLIIKFANNTNYLVSTNHSERLKQVWNIAGSNWSEKDVLICLWGYLNSKNGERSFWEDKCSLYTGRSVGSVAYKFGNFEAIETEGKSGLIGYTKLDEKIWNKFKNNDLGLFINSLEKEVEEIEDSSSIFFDDENKSSEPIIIKNDTSFEQVTYNRRMRKGQPKFRKALLEVYESKCAITGEGPECVLDAAHIEGHSESGNNDIKNGIILRADLHELFDRGLLKIDPETYKIKFAESLAETTYMSLNGVELRPRKDGSYPSKKYLEKKFNE